MVRMLAATPVVRVRVTLKSKALRCGVGHLCTLCTTRTQSLWHLAACGAAGLPAPATGARVLSTGATVP